MNSEHTIINEYVDDVHEQISLKDTIIGMGIIKEKNFTLNGFTNCIFHSICSYKSRKSPFWTYSSYIYQSEHKKRTSCRKSMIFSI